MTEEQTETEKIKDRLFLAAIKLSALRKEMREIKKQLSDIYEKHDSFDDEERVDAGIVPANQLLSDVSTVWKEMHEDGEYLSTGGDPLMYCDDRETSYETLETVFAIYVKRREIKKKLGHAKRVISTLSNTALRLTSPKQ